MKTCLKNFLVLASLLASGSMQAAVLGTYTFATSETDVPTTTGATFGQFTRVSVIQDPLAGVFRSKSWNTAGSIDAGEYVQFTITPSSGQNLNLTRISFDLLASGTFNGRVAIFTGSPLANADPLGAQATLAYTPSATPQNASFDFTDFTTAVNQGVTVRFYGWNFGNASDNMQFDNVSMEGTVVPEPVNVALAGFGIGALVIALGRYLLTVRQRRQRFSQIAS